MLEREYRDRVKLIFDAVYIMASSRNRLKNQLKRLVSSRSQQRQALQIWNDDEGKARKPSQGSREYLGVYTAETSLIGYYWEEWQLEPICMANI